MTKVPSLPYDQVIRALGMGGSQLGKKEAMFDFKSTPPQKPLN
jgi:hypothetical protein